MSEPVDPITAEDEAAARAAITAGITGIAIPHDAWTGRPDGTATHTYDDKTVLTYRPGAAAPFAASIPCSRHNRDVIAVTTADDLTAARADAAACSEGDRPTYDLPEQINALHRPGTPTIAALQALQSGIHPGLRTAAVRQPYTDPGKATA